MDWTSDSGSTIVARRPKLGCLRLGLVGANAWSAFPHHNCFCVTQFKHVHNQHNQQYLNASMVVRPSLPDKIQGGKRRDIHVREGKKKRKHESRSIDVDVYLLTIAVLLIADVKRSESEP